MANVVALKFKTRAAPLTQCLKYMLNIFKRVAKDKVTTVFQVCPFPFIAKFVVALKHREKPKVHRTHIERTHFGADSERCGETLVQGHAMATTGGNVDHGIAAVTNRGQKLHEYVRVWRGSAIGWVPRMQVNDSGARFGRIDRLLGNVFRG